MWPQGTADVPAQAYAGVPGASGAPGTNPNTVTPGAANPQAGGAAAGMVPPSYPGMPGAPVRGFPPGQGAQPGAPMNMQQAVQMQAMQAAAMQRGYAQGAFPGAMYPGYATQQYPPASGPGAQGASASGPGTQPGVGGPVPGGGAADGGLSAAYAAWAAAYGGNPAGYGGPLAGGGGAKGSGSSGGDGYQKGGRGKGKGKGKGFKGSGGGRSPLDGDRGDAGLGSPGSPGGDPRRQIELAQRRAKQRDRSAISQAQRSAQQRFERDLLERVQGNWVDASDPSTNYVVEGSLCSVSGGDNSRVFRNRLGVYGGELCWDARRFWHYLNLAALPPVDETVDRVEWNPGEGSPPTRPIVWVRAPPQLEKIQEAPADDAEEGNGEDASPTEGAQDGAVEGETNDDKAAVSMAEAVAEAAVS